MMVVISCRTINQAPGYLSLTFVCILTWKIVQFCQLRPQLTVSETIRINQGDILIREVAQMLSNPGERFLSAALG